MNVFKKAERKAKPTKGLINGPSGSGKTYTALSLLSGLTDKFCLIDSENSSAELYADKFEFDHLNLTSNSVEEYCKAISAAAAAGYRAVGIDSLSHAWEHLLEEVDNVQARTKANSFTAWKTITPIYRRLIEAIVASPIHVIATTRAKTEYVMEEQERNGKTYQVPKKVGLAPVFRQGGEYEFDWIGTIDLDHRFIIEKSRYDFLADKVIMKPDASLGKQIADWLASGATVEAVATSLEKVRHLIARNDFVSLGNHALETACSQKNRCVSDLVSTESDWCLKTLTSAERLSKLTPADREALVAYQNWYTAHSVADTINNNKGAAHE